MEEIQNEKCYACKFCIWNEEYQQEVCDIKGCYENSKFIYFLLEEREVIKNE